MRPKIKINFTDFWHPSWKSAIRDNAIYKLLSKRFELEIVDKPDFLIYSCFGKEYLKHKCVRIFYTGENVRPDFNECDYAFSFDYPVTEKNYRLPLYKLYNEFDQLETRLDNVDLIVNEDRKFCNFLYSNDKAKERIDFFKQLKKYKNVDSGGRVMNNIGYFVDDKIDFLRQYKFTIAFENTSYPGYTTEKLLQPFIASSIPIYWGNPLISRDFNTKSFINCHDYESFDEVIDRVIEIDTNDDLYNQYLHEPVFSNGVVNEYVNEENILKRFEKIFKHGNKDLVAKNTDILKYGCYLIQKPRLMRNKLKRQFHKYLTRS